MASKFGGVPVSKFGGISTLEISSGSPYKQEPSAGEKSNRQIAMDELASEYNPLQAGMISMGKGFTNVGRGLGLVDDADEIETEAMKALGERHPISTTVGEVAGEALPFLPAGGAIGGIASMPARVLATGALGATEGGVLSNARGGSLAEGAGIGGGIGMAAEVVLPYVGKLGNKIFRRVRGTPPKGALFTPDGSPTGEMQDALKSAGLTMGDLTDDAIESLGKQGVNVDPSHLARKEFLESQGIDPTKAQITRNATDFQAQQEAAKTSGRVRSALESQDDVLTTRFNNAVTNTGGDAYTPSNTVIDAVVGKATVLDKEITNLYRTARELAPGEKNVRFNSLSNELRRLAPANRRTGGNIEAIVGDLKTKGVLGKNMRIKGKVDVETAEDVRKLMNELYDPQNPFGNTILRTLKDSLDDDVFKAAGDDVFKAARKAKAGFEQELTRAKISKFDHRKQNVVRDILENKIDPDQLTERVVFGKSWRVEDLKQLKAYIGEGNAFDDLRADVLEKIKISSFIGPEDANGLKTLSRDKLERTIGKIGWPKLKVLFNNEETNFLSDMLKVSKMREPVRATALGKGPSAQAVSSLEQKLRNAPLFGFLVDVINVDAAGRAVLKAKPAKIVVERSLVQRQLPAAAAASGIAATTNQNNE